MPAAMAHGTIVVQAAVRRLAPTQLPSRSQKATELADETSAGGSVGAEGRTVGAVKRGAVDTDLELDLVLPGCLGDRDPQVEAPGVVISGGVQPIGQVPTLPGLGKRSSRGLAE